MTVCPRTREDFETWVEAALAATDQLPFATIERASGEVVGSTRYLAIAPESRRLEIGWTWLTPRVQRSAINTEAKYLQLRHCFETLGCLRVELRTDFRNERSRAAIARIGATQEGILRKQQRTQGGMTRDTVCFSILDDEWPDVKRRLEEKLRGDYPRAGK
jgi:RimJ/RimL family protein N-acetyltransferase